MMDVDEINDADESEPELSVTVRNVSSSDPEVQLNAVKTVRNFLSPGSSPRIDELIASGILPLLVECLQRHDNSALQHEAAWALTNIAGGTSEQTQAVVACQAVPHFVRLLSSPHQNVCAKAVLALGNIIGNETQCRGYVIGLGVVEPLLRLITPQFPDSLIRDITWVIVNLCRNNEPPPPIDTVKKLLPALKLLIKRSDATIVENSVLTLSYITDAGDECIQLVIESEIVPDLVALLSSPVLKLQIAALRTLGNIVTSADEQTQYVLDCGALDQFASLLTRACDKKINCEALWFLSNVTAGSEEQIQMVIDKGLVPPIIHHLDQSEYEIQREAALAISNLTNFGTQEQVAGLVVQGVIKPFCNMLSVTEPQIVHFVLEGLGNILRLEAKADDEEAKQVARMIMECGGLHRIELLQTHTNPDVYRMAFNIISNYFDDDEQ